MLNDVGSRPDILENLFLVLPEVPRFPYLMSRSLQRSHLISSSRVAANARRSYLTIT